MKMARLFLILALVGLAAACGRKGDPEPPEGEEARYTFPGRYADPATQVPTDVQPDQVGPDGLEKRDDPGPLWFLK